MLFCKSSAITIASMFVRLKSKDVLITADRHFDIIKLIGFAITLFVMHFRNTDMEFHYKESDWSGLIASGGVRQFHKKVSMFKRTFLFIKHKLFRCVSCIRRVCCWQINELNALRWPYS